MWNEVTSARGTVDPAASINPKGGMTMTDKLNQIETRYGDYKRIHTRKIQERKKLKSMIEEKNSLSPIHVFQRKDIDRKINGQEAVVRDLIEQEKEIMSWFGKTDTFTLIGNAIALPSAFP